MRSNKRSLALFCVGIVCLFALPTVYARQGAKPDYSSLLEKVKKSDRAADFTALRMAYFDNPPAESKEADPKVIQAMFAALSDKKYDKVIESGQLILNGSYVNIDAHIALAAAYQGKKDANKEKFHAWVADGLIKSIVNSGDGKSKATAWTVISTDEEYVILRSFGLTPGTQSLLNENGHYFDKMDATDPQTKKKFTLFFNIDRPYGKLGKLLKQ